MQRWFAAGLYGSSRAGSKSPKACSKRCGKPWFSQPRLADCCAILSFRSPYALAVATSLRRHGWSPVDAASDQKSPDHARILLARATVTSIFGLRGSIRANHDPAGAPRRQACRITALAPRISGRRMVRSPCFDTASSFCHLWISAAVLARAGPRSRVRLESQPRQAQARDRRGGDSSTPLPWHTDAVGGVHPISQSGCPHTAIHRSFL
jgi:hypothetical protein